MGNTNSRLPGECSDEVMASLSPQSQKRLNQLSYPNFFEAAAITPEPQPVSQRKGTSISASVDSNKSNKKEKRKISASSEESDRLSLTPVTPPIETKNRVTHLSSSSCWNSKIDFEMINGRRYQSSPGINFYLPCDDDEADRLVIMVILSNTLKKRLCDL